MSIAQISFIGIDPAIRNQEITYVAINDSLHPINNGAGDLEEVLAFVAGQGLAVVGVNAPPRLNQGIMTDPERRARFDFPPRRGRIGDLRVAEYELLRRGFPASRTPSLAEKTKPWVREGFSLYERLGALGFQPFVAGKEERQVLEVSPEACFWVWLDKEPLTQDTLGGRLQRQMVLYELGMEIPDPMLIFEEVTRHGILQGKLLEDDLCSSSELLALAVAYTVWVAVNRPQEVSFLGDEDEGHIVVPVKSLRD